MEMFAGIAPLASGLKLPFQFSGRTIDGVEDPVIAFDEHRARRHGRRRGYAATRLKLPLQRARFAIDRVEIVIGAAHIDRVADHGRRGKYLPGRMEFPFHAMKLGDSRARVHTRVLRIAAKHGSITAKRWETE